MENFLKEPDKKEKNCVYLYSFSLF